MSDTAHLKLPLIAASQSQKHVTHNEALVLLDAVVQLSVKDRDITAPPMSPAEGDRYLVASGATGAWSTWDLNVAVYMDGAWRKLVPSEGWIAWVEDENKLLVYDGSTWPDFAAAAGLVSFVALRDGTVDRIGILTAADTTNRMAVKSDAVLFSHDDVTPGTGDLRVTLNKSAAGKDAGFTFQDGFSTRALFGLLGDDDFTIKVSPDGSAFHTGISIDKDTGHVGLAGATADANNALIVKGTAFLFDKETDDCRFTFNKAAAGDDVALTFQTGYSARALIGLLGDDDFTFKVSPNGSSYTTAFTIDKDDGAVIHTEGSKFQAYCNFDKYIAANTWTKIDFNSTDHNDQGDFSAGTNTFTAPTAGYYLCGVGFRFKVNAAVPIAIKAGLGVNGANPTARNSVTQGDATIVSLESYVQCVRMLKLAAGDTVIGMGYMTTNDGYAEANENYFWGVRIA